MNTTKSTNVDLAPLCEIITRLESGSLDRREKIAQIRQFYAHIGKHIDEFKPYKKFLTKILNQFDVFNREAVELMDVDTIRNITLIERAVNAN